MSLDKNTQPASISRRKNLSYDLVAFGLVGLVLVALGLAVNSLFGVQVHAVVNWLFSLNSQQAMWYITRSAGILAYLLLWLSTAWGLLIPSKLLEPVLHGNFTYDFHQFISLLSLGFLGLHIFILTADRYLPFTLAQILIPFSAPYRPLWVGIGVIAFYLILLVPVTFYMRKRIGMKAFRMIHTLSLLAYLGGLAHAFMSGTDSSLVATQIMYAGTFLVIVFLTVYWLVMLRKSSSGSAAVEGDSTRIRLSQG
jgi:sulfoxide reductase heme-binding subunit YedZ